MDCQRKFIHCAIKINFGRYSNVRQAIQRSDYCQFRWLSDWYSKFSEMFPFLLKFFHNILTFVGFYHYPERHFELLRLLGTEFGDIAFIRPWDNKTNAGDLTIKTLDQYNKQIIVLYNDKNVIEGRSIQSHLEISMEGKKSLLEWLEKLFNRFHTNTSVSPDFYEIALNVTLGLNSFSSFLSMHKSTAIRFATHLATMANVHHSESKKKWTLGLYSKDFQ